MSVILKNLLVFLVGFLFLLSFSGIKINSHYCASCDTVKHFLFFHPDCCHSHEQKHTLAKFDASCCSLPHDNDTSPLTTEPTCSENDCCEDTFVYMKLDHTFINTVFSFNIFKTSFIENTLLLLTDFDVFFETIKHNIVLYDPPPLLNYGKTFVSFTSGFIFYDC